MVNRRRRMVRARWQTPACVKQSLYERKNKKNHMKDGPESRKILIIKDYEHKINNMINHMKHAQFKTGHSWYMEGKTTQKYGYECHQETGNHMFPQAVLYIGKTSLKRAIYWERI